MSEQFLRQRGLVNMSRLQSAKYYVCGVGGIGSAATLLLAKMGGRDITVYDFDTLEEHNISNQMYPLHEIESPKVEAMQRMVKHFEGIDIEAVHGHMTGSEEFDGGVLLICVDSMTARKSIFDNLKRNMKGPDILIDARMGGQELSMYYVDMSKTEDRNKYEGTLYSDEDAVSDPCTERAILFNTAKIGAMMCNAIKRYINGEDHPFSYHYDFKALEGMVI